MSQPEASLNDDAVSDLGNSGFITEPNQEGVKKDKVLTVNTSDDPLEPTEISQRELMQAVGQSEVVIKAVVDQEPIVKTLEDITETIFAQESISASQAYALDKQLSGKLLEAIPVNRFTDVPTRTSLPQVKSFAAKYMDEVKSQALDSQQKLKDSFPAWSKTVQETARVMMAKVAESLQGLRTQAQSFVSDPPDDRRYLVYIKPVKDGLINLRKAPISVYCTSSIVSDKPEMAVLAKAVTSLSMSNLPKAACVIRLAMFGKVNPDLGVLEESGQLTSCSTSLISIAACLAGPDCIAQIEELTASMETINAEEDPGDMARKMRDVNNMVTTAVEMTAAIELISNYFAAVEKVRDSNSN